MDEENIYDSGIYGDGYQFDTSSFSEDELNTPTDYSGMYNSGVYNQNLPLNEAQENQLYDYSQGGTANPQDFLLKNVDGQYGGFIDAASGQPQYYNDLGQAPASNLPGLGGLSNTLAGIFNNKTAMTGLSALLEGMQNKKKQAASQQLVQQMQPALDPFGGQRQFYQQQLQKAVQDPYSAPIVRDQVAQIQRAQAIKDAAAGRRSNSATSDPAMLAAQAQIAQQYMNSLQTPAGANISPNSLSSLIQPQMQGINSGINGYVSPAMTAIQRQNQMDELTQLLEKYRSQ